MWVIAALAVGLVALFVACKPSTDEGPKTQPATIDFKSVSDLEPDKLPYERASLILAGASYPVEVERKVDGERVTFLFKSHGEVLDKESYRLGTQTFQLVQGAGMTFEPPIDLVLFPMAVGQSWGWSGRISSGVDTQNAHATVSSEPASLNLPNGYFEGFKVAVDLEISDSTPAVTKSMAFWLVPKRGIMKREFGSTSTRGPATE